MRVLCKWTLAALALWRRARPSWTFLSPPLSGATRGRRKGARLSIWRRAPVGGPKRVAPDRGPAERVCD